MVSESVKSIVCPSCNYTYTMSESKVPVNGGTATCKKCGNRITVRGSHEAVQAVAGKPATNETTSPAPSRKPNASPPAPALVEDYPELQYLPSSRLDLREIFTPKKNGKYKSSLNTYKLKVIKAVQDKLSKVLEKEERVLRVGAGTLYYPAELFFGNGYLTMMYNRYAILCTNERVLLINVDNRMRQPTHYLFQIPYPNLKKVVLSSLFGRIICKMHHGKNRTLTGIKRGAAKELSQFLKGKMEDRPATFAPGGALEHLCPACYAPLGSGLAQCTQCRLDFKSPRTAMLRSLFLPGLGDLYLGHRFLGIMEIIGSLFVWLIVLLSILDGQFGMIILLVIVNGMDALLTHHMSKKGYMAV